MMVFSRNGSNRLSLLAGFSLFLSTAIAQSTMQPMELDSPWPNQTWVTEDFKSPVLDITRVEKSSESLLFFAPDGSGVNFAAPVIMDITKRDRGDLVWQGPEGHAFAFGAYEYKGEKVLAWWNGTLFPEPVGRGNGVINVLNKHYEQIHRVTLEGNFVELEPGARFDSNIDVHEVYFTERGSVVVTANNVTQADLTSVGGPRRGWVVDCLVYEIDVESNEVLFRWSSLEHLDQLPFTTSKYPLGSEGFTGQTQDVAWGYFHINSAEPYEGGYIVSARYLCSAIAIDGQDGHVKWRLDGREDADFEIVGSKSKTGFCYQHDVRVREKRESGITITMHDNHNCPIENGTVPSTAKALDLDFNTMKATLVHRYFNRTAPTFATAQGNYQTLPDGDVFVGHGYIPVMEEFSAQGQPLNRVQFGDAVERRRGGGFLSAEEEPTLSYRDFKHEWIGCPTASPKIVAYQGSDGAVESFVSWNGATDVMQWNYWIGDSPGCLYNFVNLTSQGFQTAAKTRPARYIQARPVLKEGSPCEARNSCVMEVHLR